MTLIHDKDRRDALRLAKAQVRELERPDREQRKIAQAKLRASRERRPERVQHTRAKPKGGREVDHGFMSWQHESGLTCIACEILGAPTPGQLQGERNPIEVAHQRVDGWKKGVRGHDRHSCPLCRWHHQLAPNACDKGQKAFWERLGIDAADFCAALYATFMGGSPGAAVIRRFIPTRTPA